MKKNIFLKTFIMLVAIVMCSNASATVYHLICRGGATGNTRLDFESFAAASNGTGSFTYIAYIFERYTGAKATIKKDGSHLSPGQCSWATDVVRAPYNYFTHTIDNPGTGLLASVTPQVTGDQRQTSITTTATFIPNSADPDQAYLPLFSFNNPASEWSGSILDPQWVFHFYMKIRPEDGTLQFYSLSSKAKVF